MLKVENTDVFGWEAAIRGMRNPMNSWDRSDSSFTCETCEGCYYQHDCHEVIEETDDATNTINWCNHTPCRVGENDLKLMKALSKAGSDHAKFLRMINVTVDITAPLYLWKEYDTYKVGTVANSCSTMHKIHSKEFTVDDFSCEHLFRSYDDDETVCFDGEYPYTAYEMIEDVIVPVLNQYRQKFIETKNKRYWWQMIQLLPSSYNQKRTVQFNYQVLKSMYFARKDHKLDEWHTLCDWMLTLPYFKEICVDV